MHSTGSSSKSTTFPGLRATARACTALLLCTDLAKAPLRAELLPPAPAASSHTRSNPAEVPLNPDQRVLHALNRLTFGPRPGEAAEVGRIGLKAWFDMELNPERIDDSALEARLAAFPAMALPQAELIRRFPSPQVLRAMIQRNLPLPQDPIEHAIYADDIAFYKEAQARKAAGAPAPNAPGTQVSAMQTPPAEASAMQTPETSTPAAEPSPAPGASPAAHKGRARVDLLGPDNPEYSINRKKSPPPPSPDINAESSMGAQESMAARPANRVRLEHNESAFPEAATAAILALAPEARVSRILALGPTELVNFRRSLTQSELAAAARDLTPQQKETFAALGSSARMVGAEVLESRIERDVYSRREVEAVMTDFWLNHFNIYIRKNQNETYLLPAFERETVRPHALGRFEDLLVATAKSPAMLMYLDNWQSIGPNSDAAHRGARFAGLARDPQVKQKLKDRGLNENYARELMELHTIGVGCEVSKDHPVTQLDPACGKGYTQADVTELAKVFSGWTIDRPAQGGEYSFEERRHEPGKKTVLGQTIHENGEKEGLEVLHMLASSPATARFLSTKLAVRFVSDTPPPALVDRMTRSYLSSGGEIRAVLRTMFDSPEFWRPEVYRAKVKTPLEFVASALRATDADISNAVPVVQSLERLGMPLYGMQTPNGYSWKSDTWVSTGALVSRMNFALVLSADRLPGTRTDQSLLVADAPAAAHNVALVNGAAPSASVVATELRLEKILLGAPASDRTRNAVLAQSGDTSLPQQAERDLLSTAPGAPSSPKRDNATRKSAQQDTPSPAERQAATMAGLLLGSPEFQRR